MTLTCAAIIHGILIAPVLDSGMNLLDLLIVARALGSCQHFPVITVPAPTQFFGITRVCDLFAHQVVTGNVLRDLPWPSVEGDNPQ